MAQLSIDLSRGSNSYIAKWEGEHKIAEKSATMVRPYPRFIYHGNNGRGEPGWPSFGAGLCSPPSERYWKDSKKLQQFCVFPLTVNGVYLRFRDILQRCTLRNKKKTG